MNMKKSKLIMCLTSMLVLAGCGQTSGDKVTNAKASFVKEAATSLSMYKNAIQPSILRRNAKRNASAADIEKEYENIVRSYLPTVEAALITEDLYNIVSDVASDKAEYAQMYTVTYKDMNSVSNTFKLYFNETPKVETENKDHDDHDEKDDFEEVESTLAGIAIFDETEYVIRGEKELEGDEMEMKFEFQWAENSYIRIEQEIEKDEVEFVYKLYEDDRKVYEYSLEIETEDGEKQLNLKEKTLSTKLKIDFKFFVDNDVTFIKARVKEGDQKIEFLFKKIVDSETNSITYELVTK